MHDNPTCGTMSGGGLIGAAIGFTLWAIYVVIVASNTHSHSQAGASVDADFCALLIPVASTLGGILVGTFRPLACFGNCLIMLLALIVGVVAGGFALFVAFLTAFTGYC
jgi:hypothetical protein